MSESDDIGDEDFEYEEDFLPDLFRNDAGQMFGLSFCSFIVQRFARDFGDEALVDLMYAIDRTMGWSSEITGKRTEVDDLLFERHGSFDHHIWEKVQDTKAWAKMRRQLYKTSRKYLAAAVDEVVQRELQDTP